MIWVSLRLANIYGPRQDSQGEAGIIAIFINKMLNGEIPIINGDGKHTRDYLYVHDLVDAIMLSMIHEESDYFNISSGVEVSNLEVFEAVKNALNSGQPATFGPDRPGDVRRNVLDNKKAGQILGWSPKVDINEGIKLTIQSQKSGK